MSDEIKHECGIALLRLKKPLSYYKEKYGSAFFGIQKMYLLMEKQHNRGQDGAGFASIKLDMDAGERYISRIRSNQPQAIQDVFSQINGRINEILEGNPSFCDDIDTLKRELPYVGEVYLGHVRYGTFGKNSIENVHPFLRQNNWQNRNLLVAGNFNLTNVKQLFQDLVNLGQHPKEIADTVTVMEKIGHFLDNEVEDLYRELKDTEGCSKKDASPVISKRLNVGKILKRASKNWDGGFAMAGMIGNGDAFVLRDAAGIRPAFYYEDEELVVVASERPVIQTTFNLPTEVIKEIEPGQAIIIKKNAQVSFEQILEPTVKKACSFERIYFSRGNDADIYQERKKLGNTLMPSILDEINHDIDNTVFSYIPNTAEVSFFGMVEKAQDFLNDRKTKQILAEPSLSEERLKEILSKTIRTEKITIKDAKLRTFITDDSNRDDMVAHVYDVTYGVVKPTDNLVVIDDSIVRGTTLKKSIIKMLDRLNPKKIVIVSSAPQIRYPDCYGIDMAKLETLIAFNAALELLKETNQYHLVQEVYEKCKAQETLPDEEVTNFVKEIYEPFTAEEISAKISQMVKAEEVNAEVSVIFQTIENLHLSCPNNLGDWYFTGNYPTAGGNRVVNRAFINFYEGNDARAY